MIELLVVVAIIAVLIAILLPALNLAREDARWVYCQNNIKQMLIATSVYQSVSNDRFPIAYVYDSNWNELAWDFFCIYSENRYEIGWLWRVNGGTIEKVQKCPSFTKENGSWGWSDLRPYTGYNYNTTYIGGGTFEPLLKSPINLSAINYPSDCAVFGDGEYYNQFMKVSAPNNYMRAPSDSFAALGTQGFRHAGKTNVGFADGHCKSLTKRFTAGYPEVEASENCGFISADDSLYDLE